MTPADVSLMNQFDENGVDETPLTPPPAPRPMPIRRTRTVGSMVIDTLSGLALTGPASLQGPAAAPDSTSVIG